MLFPLLQAAEAVPVPQEMSYSLIDMAVKGGWLMIVLLVLSLLAIYIFGKKLSQITRAAKVSKDFMDDVRDYIHDGKVKSAITYCGKFDTPVARVVEKGLEYMGKPNAEVRAAMENVASLEVAKLEKGLPGLATISGGAPMIGFLGTVTGMIRAFFNMANAGNNIDITLLSSGIYEAMVTTVGGLIVGILAYFGYNFLSSRIGTVTLALENAVTDFMDTLNAPAEAPKTQE